MGWFDEQIRQRIKNDDELFSDACAQMVNLVSNEKITTGFFDNRRPAEEAIGDILKYYHVQPTEIPENLKNIDEILEYLLRPSGIMRRNVKLTAGWYKDAVGAMLSTKRDGSVTALIPDGFRGYSCRDYITGEVKKINASNAGDIDEDAICFYQPFPLKKLKMMDLLIYIFKQLRRADCVLMLILTAVATLIGLAVPRISHYLYGEVLTYKSGMLLMSVIITFFCVRLSGLLIDAIKEILNTNISLKINLAIESAVMMRVLSLPVEFIKKYSSGELAGRISYMNRLCSMIFDSIFSVGVTALFSLIYIRQIVVFTPALMVPAIMVIVLTCGISVISALVQMSITEKQMAADGAEQGMVYALVSGISKIKIAGAEKRAFARWSRQYVKAAKYLYSPPKLLRLNNVIITAISLIGMIVMYYEAIESHETPADFMAFNSAYGMVNGAFMSLAGVVVSVSKIKPIVKMVEPILEAEPEIDTKRHVVTRLRGGIELNNISFRYSENMPKVIDNLSLKIRPGQYVAIVGKTGCGKSTLMRILLGFEKPQKGAVYYDGKDISTMDLKSLRQKIGVVMQSEKLLAGSIFSNIVISSPELSIEQAWEAAEIAGIAEDIRKMPMGMQTVIVDGYGMISGGQKQRLMIARAIASKPRILMFDEATSALDNITQKNISEALEKLKCTRIVIAHRLSTIKNCDRIIVLDNGGIAEDGTYEELIARGGLFSELVERQRVDT